MERWHVGTVVGDIAAAVADYRRLGPCTTSPVTRLSTQIYDAEVGDVVDESVDVAFVRDAGGETFELIAPLNSFGPQARFLAARPGPSHVAYWCADPVETARTLLAEGAHLVLAALTTTEGWRDRVDRGGPASLLELAIATYLRMPGGLMIELNAPSSRASIADRWHAAA